MPDFDVDLRPVYVFRIEDRYLFRHYFEETSLFDALSEYYDGENYRFEVPVEVFDEVAETLGEYYYEPSLVPEDEMAAYCVVKEQYTSHTEILKHSVIHWSRDGYNFFLMQDPQAVDYALEQGAQRLAATNFVLSI